MKRDRTEAYTLDADATGIVAEKADAYYTYRGDKGYMPMLGFLYELRLCIYDEFREGNTSPGYGQREFYRQCKERMPCGQTEANAVFFRIGVIAYNLFIGFKRLSCPEGLIRHTIETFRLKIIQVARRIVSIQRV